MRAASKSMAAEAESADKKPPSRTSNRIRAFMVEKRDAKE
jgi:hypothetical protein